MSATHTLIEGGVGVLYRTAAHPTRGVWLEAAGDPRYRLHQATSRSGGGLGSSLRTSGVLCAGIDPKQTANKVGITVHVPLTVYGLGGPSATPRALIASSTHLYVAVNKSMKPSDLEAASISGSMGRDFLRLPRALRSCWPTLDRPPAMILGGDMNVGKTADSGDERPSSIHFELTRREQWPAADSEDEWTEDEDEEIAWPPVTPPIVTPPSVTPPSVTPPPARREVSARLLREAPKTLSHDLWRDPGAAMSREYGGLQRGSTCVSALLQNFRGEQGIAARALNEKWPADGVCVDHGHIDWLLASHGGAAVTAKAVGVCTERVCPPLLPQQPSLFGGTRLPPGGAIFASDHYPVWADVELG